ncbi:putative transcriptional regulator YdeE [Paenibacillus sp. V4I9]|uniref:GyrI-like domain-containing protein n=1 Tax=Paenibacillus sp. V4I9 TaxID=3042308 RepID=UPI0027831C50|nr:GyrI-like domain-containing protein [Paenibacillus sp. V4I9]MDQ0885889.1 putative transcriptional regulator YdeE [Paenibacillus sp. V4I9]
MSDNNQVYEFELPEINLVGMCITSPFKGHLSERVEDMKKEFFRRKDEIRNIIHPERYVSPSFSSEILFTYFVCMEVADITDIPEGMLGFTIPPHRYAKVKSTSDPYRDIHDYLKANNKQNNNRALAFEMYHFENPVWPDEAEVYIPIMD